MQDFPSQPNDNKLISAAISISEISRDELCKTEEELTLFKQFFNYIKELNLFRDIPQGYCRHCIFNSIFRRLYQLVEKDSDNGISNFMQEIVILDTSDQILSYVEGLNGEERVRIEIEDYTGKLSFHLNGFHGYDSIDKETVTTKKAYEQYWTTTIDTGIMSHQNGGNVPIGRLIKQNTVKNHREILRLELSDQEIQNLSEEDLNTYYRGVLNILADIGRNTAKDAFEHVVTSYGFYTVHQVLEILKEQIGLVLYPSNLNPLILIAEKKGLVSLSESDTGLIATDTNTGNFWIAKLSPPTDSNSDKSKKRKYIYGPEFIEFIINYYKERELARSQPLEGYIRLNTYLNEIDDPELDEKDINAIRVAIQEEISNGYIQSYRDYAARFVLYEDIDFVVKSMILKEKARRKGMVTIATATEMLAKDPSCLHLSATTIRRHIDKSILINQEGDPIYSITVEGATINKHQYRSAVYVYYEDLREFYKMGPNEIDFRSVKHVLKQLIREPSDLNSLDNFFRELTKNYKNTHKLRQIGNRDSVIDKKILKKEIENYCLRNSISLFIDWNDVYTKIASEEVQDDNVEQ